MLTFSDQILAPFLHINPNMYANNDYCEDQVEYKVPEHCIPIRADVRRLDWKVCRNDKFVK